MRTFEWAIEDVIAAYPDLGVDDYAGMAVALMKQAGQPCEFKVRISGFDIGELEGDSEFLLHVIWDSRTEVAADRIERTRQRPQIVEGGAIGLALLLFAHLVQNSELYVTVVKDRADYWLPRLYRALEISGTEKRRELPRRYRVKRRQVRENSQGWDGYVVLCCFAETERAIQWSYHPQTR